MKDRCDVCLSRHARELTEEERRETSVAPWVVYACDQCVARFRAGRVKDEIHDVSKQSWHGSGKRGRRGR